MGRSKRRQRPGLVLTIKRGHSLHIGDEITVTVQRVGRTEVRLRIEAPRDVRVLRDVVAARQATEEVDQ